MLSIASFRLATRYTFKPAHLLISRVIPSQTRSFLTVTVPLNEPAKGSKNKKETPKTKATAKKRASTVENSKPKVETQPKKVIIPPNMKPPRPPASSYLLFYKDKLATQPHENDLTSMVAATRDMSAKWNALSDEEKLPYVHKATVLREAYKKERDAWFNTIDPTVFAEINRRRVAHGKQRILKRRKPSALKRPLSSFIYFIMEYRKKAPGPAKEAFTKAGQIWRSMSASEKEPYLELTRASIQEYIAAKARQST